MAVVLTVHADAWRHHVDEFTGRFGPALVPVVKGNGYGFGRERLARLVGELGLPEFAVGTVYELTSEPDLATVRQLVLTPELEPYGDAFGANVVLTAGNAGQLAAAAEHPGPVALKLSSSMQRYGAGPDELPDLLARLPFPHALLLHLPLAGDDADRVAEIEAWLPLLPSDVPLSVSHLAPDTFAALVDRHRRPLLLRAGTRLWHGSREQLRLSADVLEVRAVVAGSRAGYRANAVPGDGHLVMIGAGSSHGVQPLPDGRSPFHFEHTRLALLEPPHMHTSMGFVPSGDPCPRPGELVDVQRPLTQTMPDRIVWVV